MARIGMYVSDSDGKKAWAITKPRRDEISNFETFEPLLSIDTKEELQELFDDLWILGIRPSARSDEYKAQLESVKDHLNDMRALVFKDKREDL